MVIAAVNDNGYNVVLLLHLLSVIIGTGAAFLAPALLSREQKQSKSAQVQRLRFWQR